MFSGVLFTLITVYMTTIGGIPTELSLDTNSVSDIKLNNPKDDTGKANQPVDTRLSPDRTPGDKSANNVNESGGTNQKTNTEPAKNEKQKPVKSTSTKLISTSLFMWAIFVHWFINNNS
ncbi:hypothetical protein EG68_09509 [Paragonimus skrjabini miyazakii]|uniref:Uncharacterized protein n=1 Tax=Paragonimus skrjabini miyazakii TaxID=59628 RepID=A0A8S9YHC9_9TREM|nr:hypothetical protein EG68_09509 [Paragonimus skrjabini miyazakii]